MKLKSFLQIIILISSIVVSFYLGRYSKSSCTPYKVSNYIEAEERKCIESSNVIDYPMCSKKAEIAWDREIQSNLDKLKNIMSKEDFEYIQIMHSNWNESVLSEINAINKFIYDRDGIIYQTLGSNKITELKKQYGALLYSIYDNYNEEKTNK